MKLSKDGAAYLGKVEGVRLRLYDDHNGDTWMGQSIDEAVGYWTIGIGHLVGDDEFEGYKAGITMAEAIELFQDDVEPFEDAVLKYVKVPLTQPQFDALVVFSFNVGVNAFRKSTLVRLLNRSLYDAVPEQLLRWTTSKGKVLEGLKIRRLKTIDVWNAGDYDAILGN